MTAGDWAKVKYFEPSEFRNPGKMSFELLQKLDIARHVAGIAFNVTSSFRPGDTGAHGKGLAVDIRARGSMDRLKIVDAGLRSGFKRIGVYDRHIHLDIDTSLPDGMWQGESE